MPAVVLLEMTVVDLQPGGKRCHHILWFGVGTPDFVEQRHGSPWFEYAHDPYVAAPQPQRAPHAVDATKQLVVQVIGDHCHPRMLSVIVCAPTTSVSKRHREHWEELGGGGKHVQPQRRQRGIRRHHLNHAVHDQRLPIGAMCAPQVDRRVVVHDGRWLPGVRPGRVWTHLRKVDLPAAARQRITRQQMHHRQRGHARADADRDSQHHQRGEHRTAAQAAHGQIKVIAEHVNSLLQASRFARTTVGAASAAMLLPVVKLLVITPTWSPPLVAQQPRDGRVPSRQSGPAATASARRRAGSTRASGPSRSAASGTG
jgi:hypothetical protein